MDGADDRGIPLTNLLPFIVSGIATGSIYGLAATGLVLTYKTSGIFNFGYGALATAAAYVFYWLYVDHGVDWKLAAFLSVFVLGPADGPRDGADRPAASRRSARRGRSSARWA